jgi:hypothetical protein
MLLGRPHLSDLTPNLMTSDAAIKGYSQQCRGGLVSHILLKNILLVSERLYHLLLFAYPATHRREYGPLMVQLFRDLCRDSYRQKGFVGFVRLWSHVLTDTIVTVGVEHFYVLHKGGQIMTRKQHWMVLVLTGLPLEFGLLLYLINPAFMSQMLAPTAAQPVGWLMTAAVLILVGTAYVVQRRVIVLSQLSDPSGQAVSGRASRIAWTILLGPFRSIALNGHREKGFLFACSILLLVLPAMFLVVFGPAVLTVLNAGLYP